MVDSVRPGTKGIEEADDLEERITDAIEDLDVIDMASIDVHVEDGTVTLEGAVDDATTARRIVRRIQRVAGVRELVNNLRLEGVDSHIPDDD
nr:BON domain-containing protein [Neorhizobium galegae]